MVFDLHTHQLNPAHFAIQNLPPDELDANPAQNSGRFVSTGIHPWDLTKYTVADFWKLRKTAANPCVCMIGECGFDKNIAQSFGIQLKVFKLHIALSEQHKKPLLIHCVGYFNELFELKQRMNPTQKWIIHGFRSKPELARQALKLGFSLSYGEKFNPQALRNTPADRLFIETDASSLSFDEICDKIAQIVPFPLSETASGNPASILPSYSL